MSVMNETKTPLVLTLVGIEDVAFSDFVKAIEEKPSGFEVMVKGKKHKYVLRVPTGKIKPKWRYYYELPRGGIINREKLVQGATFRHGAGDEAGHYHVKEIHDDGTVSIYHDVTKKKTRMKIAELRDLAHRGKHKLDEKLKYGSPEEKGGKILDLYKRALNGEFSPQKKGALRRMFLEHLDTYPQIAGNLTEEFVQVDIRAQKKLLSLGDGGISSFKAVKAIKYNKEGERVGGETVEVSVKHMDYADAISESMKHVTKGTEEYEAAKKKIVNLLKKAAQKGIDGSKKYSSKTASGKKAEALLSSVRFQLEKMQQKANNSGSWAKDYYIDGQKISGVRKYVGKDKSKQGNLYLSGVLQGAENVLDEGFGSLLSKEEDFEKALKKIARRLTPVGSWVQYRVHASGIKNLEHTDASGQVKKPKKVKIKKTKKKVIEEKPKKVTVKAPKKKATPKKKVTVKVPKFEPVPVVKPEPIVEPIKGEVSETVIAAGDFDAHSHFGFEDTPEGRKFASAPILQTELAKNVHESLKSLTKDGFDKGYQRLLVKKAFPDFTDNEKAIFHALAIFTADTKHCKALRKPDEYFSEVKPYSTVTGANVYTGHVINDHKKQARVEAGAGGELNLSWKSGMKAPELQDFKNGHNILKSIASMPYSRYKDGKKIPLYRGMKMTAEYFNQLEVGKDFPMGDFSSWSESKASATSFAGGEYPVVFEMHNPMNGTPISPYSYYGTKESETLVAGDIRVVSMEKPKNSWGHWKVVVTHDAPADTEFLKSMSAEDREKWKDLFGEPMRDEKQRKKWRRLDKERMRKERLEEKKLQDAEDAKKSVGFSIIVKKD